MTTNEIKNFFSKITNQAFEELDDNSDSETLDLFFLNMIKMMSEIYSAGMDYIGSPDWNEMIEYYKERLELENEIKGKFPEEVVSFLNEWDTVDDGSNTITFYSTDDLKNWDIKDSMRMVGELVQTGIFWHIGTKDKGFYMTKENYELLKKAARIYGII